MIIIPPALKPQLNQLIAYYKKHSDDPTYQSKNFIYDENGIKICSVSTLSRIVNNKILCMDDKYFQFCRKLNRDFIYDENLNEVLHDCNKNLLSGAEINSVDKIIRLLSKASSLLTPYTTYMIYGEYKEIYDILLLYYTKQEFNKDKLDKYIELFDLIPEELKPIFLSIAYHYYSRVNIEEFISIEIIEKSLKIKQNSIITLHLRCAFYLRSNQDSILKEYAKRGVQISKNTNNKYYLVRFYNFLAYHYRFTKPELAIHYLTLCIANYNEKNDPYSTLSAFYHNMIHLSYARGNWASILHIYYKHLYDDSIFIANLFYILISIMRKSSNNKIEIYRIFEITYLNRQSLSRHHSLMLDLYEAIYIKNNFALFLDNLNDLINFKTYFEDESLLKQVLLEEIRAFCISNNKYTSYITFAENFQ